MKVIRVVCSLCLLLISILIIAQPVTLLAQGESPTQGKLELTASHTKLEGTSGSSFEFEVKLTYQGDKATTFDLSVTGPKQWDVYVTPSYPKDKRIKDIRLEPGGYGETLSVTATPPLWLKSEPGEYQITLEVSSGEIRGTITFTAVVTAKYSLSLAPADERYNTTAKAGKNNFFSIEVRNEGSAPIDNITFSSTKPEGWSIEFSLDKVDSLKADKFQTIDVNIKPGAKTIAGDYMVTLQASGKEASADKPLDIRVTVETPTIWGWTGVSIILIVVAGLAFVIMRFSRR